MMLFSWISILRNILFFNFLFVVNASVNDTSASSTFSPLDVLCFAMENPADRAFCGNKASTPCLLQRMGKDYSPKGFHCSTDAAAEVDMSLLKKYSSVASCRKKKEKANSVWIATQVKNDAQTMIEWLIWHFLLGVDHALIYDNESTDNMKVALKPFIAEGLVDYIYFPGIGVQSKAYTDALARAKKAGITWLAAIDVDEYIAPIVDRCITDFLSRFASQKDIGGVRLNWQYVNSMGKLWRWENDVLDQTVLDRTGFYTGRSDQHVKTIARVSRTVKYVDAHYAIHSRGDFAVSPDTGRRGSYHFTNPPQTKTAVMLHMHIRTLEEWIIKRLRGRGSVKKNQCPYCNATLETLTAEWLCLNSGGFGIPDKDSAHKCQDKKSIPMLNQAPNNWAQPLNVELANVLKRVSKTMHSILKMPIESNTLILLNEGNITERRITAKKSI